MSLSLGTGLLFGRRKEDLVFTWFVQTAIFVLFNKVCTSQVCTHSVVHLSFLQNLTLSPTVLPVVPPSITPAYTPPRPLPSPSWYALIDLGWHTGIMALRSV